MLARMRTTLVIDGAVLRRAKMAAARAGTTLSAVVERALRDSLRDEAPPKAKPFVFPTFGGRPRKSGSHTPADFAAALHDEDVAGWEGTPRRR
jgi:hypothetical protein